MICMHYNNKHKLLKDKENVATSYKFTINT